MKKLLAFAVAAVVAWSAASVFAGGSCCSAGKAKTSAGAGCDSMFSKLNLSKEQQAKVTALMEQCKRATSTSECHDIMSKGLQQILTPEQFAQWKADCGKAATSGECPYMKGQKKS
jgi:Spy/CpxP family protein refolding chaperone